MRDPSGWPTLFGSDAAIWSRYLIVAVVAIVAAGVIHAALVFILKRAAARTKTQTDDILLEHNLIRQSREGFPHS